MKPRPGLRFRVFHILTSEDFDDFTDVLVILMSSKYKGLSYVLSDSRLDA